MFAKLGDVFHIDFAILFLNDKGRREESLRATSPAYEKEVESQKTSSITALVPLPLPPRLSPFYAAN